MCVVYLLPLQFNGGGFGLLDHEDPVTPPPSEEHSWCGHLRPGKWVARPKYFTATARKNERNSCHVCTFLCENKRSDSKSHFRQCQGSWSQSRRHKPVRGGGVVQGNMATWPIALICVTCATLRIYNDTWEETMFIRIFLGGLGPLTSPAVWFLACFVSSTWFSLPVDFSPNSKPRSSWFSAQPRHWQRQLCLSCLQSSAAAWRFWWTKVLRTQMRWQRVTAVQSKMFGNWLWGSRSGSNTTPSQ